MSKADIDTSTNKASAADIDVQDMSKDECMTTLITTYEMTYNEANAWWKVNGKKVSTGFAGEFYDLLRSGIMDENEFETLLKAGSSNVQKHKSHYDAIRVLCNDIHGE